MSARVSGYVTYKGLTFPIRGWAVRMQIDHRIIEHRLKHRWSVRRALTTVPTDKELELAPKLQPKPRQPPLQIEYGGQSMSVRSWSRKLDLYESTIRDRHRMGLPPTQVLGYEKPIFPERSGAKTYTHNGKTLTARGWSKELGISASWLTRKFKSDMPDEKKFAPKHKPKRKKPKNRKRVLKKRLRSFALGLDAVATDAVPSGRPSSPVSASR